MAGPARNGKRVLVPVEENLPLEDFLISKPAQTCERFSNPAPSGPGLGWNRIRKTPVENSVSKPRL